MKTTNNKLEVETSKFEISSEDVKAILIVTVLGFLMLIINF